MRSSTLEVLADPHPGRSLVIRGRAMRTFSSIASFLALTLLALGVYIIKEEFANPIAAQSIALLTAAFALATGVTLLVYLIPPRSSMWRDNSVEVSSVSLDWVEWAAENGPSDSDEQRTDLPFQRWYVDPARIPPR